MLGFKAMKGLKLGVVRQKAEGMEYLEREFHDEQPDAVEKVMEFSAKKLDALAELATSEQQSVIDTLNLMFATFERHLIRDFFHPGTRISLTLLEKTIFSTSQKLWIVQTAREAQMKREFIDEIRLEKMGRMAREQILLSKAMGGLARNIEMMVESEETATSKLAESRFRRISKGFFARVQKDILLKTLCENYMVLSQGRRQAEVMRSSKKMLNYWREQLEVVREKKKEQIAVGYSESTLLSAAFFGLKTYKKSRAHRAEHMRCLQRIEERVKMEAFESIEDTTWQKDLVAIAHWKLSLGKRCIDRLRAMGSLGKAMKLLGLRRCFKAWKRRLGLFDPRVRFNRTNLLMKAWLGLKQERLLAKEETLFEEKATNFRTMKVHIFLRKMLSSWRMISVEQTAYQKLLREQEREKESKKKKQAEVDRQREEAANDIVGDVQYSLGLCAKRRVLGAFREFTKKAKIEKLKVEFGLLSL